MKKHGYDNRVFWFLVFRRNSVAFLGCPDVRRQ